mgnify:CR=1 FL=1
MTGTKLRFSALPASKDMYRSCARTATLSLTGSTHQQRSRTHHHVLQVLQVGSYHGCCAA